MPSVELVSARTTHPEPEKAAEDIANQIGSATPKLLTVFASRDRDQRALNKALRERLPKARLIGATTAGEIDREGIHFGSVVVSALTGDLEVGIGVGKELSHNAVQAGENAIDQACSELGVRGDALSSKKHVAVVIDDGFRMKKEELLIGIMSKNQGLVAVGGGAADNDMTRMSAELHVDGEVTTDSAMVVLFKTDAPWAALRSHWYHPTGKTITLTKVDARTNRAIEIDGQPAAKRYAELLGVEIPDLEFGKPNGFAAMPTALRVGREYFIRAPWRVAEDGSIFFANMLEERTELELVKIGDMVADTMKFFREEVPNRVKNPSAALLFHCGARLMHAMNSGKLDGLSQTFAAAPPCAGMNVFFETYCGFQINATLTSLIFGASA